MITIVMSLAYYTVQATFMIASVMSLAYYTV